MERTAETVELRQRNDTHSNLPLAEPIFTKARVVRVITYYAIFTIVVSFCSIALKNHLSIFYLLGFLGPIGFAYLGLLSTLYPSGWLASDVALSLTIFYFAYSAVCLFLFYFFLYVGWFIRWFFLVAGVVIWISAIVPLVLLSIGNT